mmetsp:Transcript_37829/g.82916  ORF Transcript_37829/g.82916 Transcript_37829/m.82916 type:complete len:90 (+) Transcript_37829:157-426(+)
MVDELFTSSGAGEAVAESSDMFISSVGYCTNVTTSRRVLMVSAAGVSFLPLQCNAIDHPLFFSSLTSRKTKSIDVSTTGIWRQVLSVPT